MRTLLWACTLTVMVACGTGSPGNPEPVAVPKVDPATRVADAETRAALTTLSFDNATTCAPTSAAFPRASTSYRPVDAATIPFVRCASRFVFSKSTAQLAALKPGELLVGEPGPGAPYGYLQRVKTVTPSGDTVVVTGEQASLDEALVEGEFKQERVLTPGDLAALSLAPGVSRAGAPRGAALGVQTVLGPQATYSLTIDKVLYDVDDNPSTTNDQVRVKGDFALGVEDGLSMSLRWKKVLGVPIYPKGVTFRLAYGFDQSAHLRVETDLNVTALDKEIELATYTFSPITFFVGPVPVVLVPSVKITADLKGTVSAKLTFGAAEHIKALAGFEYNGDFKNITGLTRDFSKFVDPPSVAGRLEGGLNVKGDILLYGLVGPYARVRGAVTFDAALPRDPVWTLSAAVQAYAGIHADLLVKQLDYDAKIIDEPLFEFGRSTPQPPSVSITTPKDGTALLRNGVSAQGVCVAASDPQQGTLAAQVTANGVVIGTTDPAKGNCVALPGSVVGTVGSVSLKATVTNKAGLSATASSAITVVNVPPTPYIVKPSAGDAIYDGQTVQLQGYVISGSDRIECPLPGGAVTLAFTSSRATDTMPGNVCATPTATFNGTGPRTLTLRATDTLGAPGTATLTVNVLPKPVNYPPDAALIDPVIKDPANPPSYMGTATTVSLTARVIDQDSATITYSWALRPSPGASTVPLSSGTATGASQPGGTTVSTSFSTALLPRYCGGLSGDPFTVFLTVSDGTNSRTSSYTLGTYSGIC